MRRRTTTPYRVIGTALLLGLLAGNLATAADVDGELLFDGKTLDGWDGNPEFWRVEDGAITGQTTKDKPTKGNTFIIWRGGKVGDFELTLEYRIFDGNSGIQYRSFEVPNNKWVIGGYQGDFEAGKTYSGILYGEKFRGILCKRGLQTKLTRENGKFKVLNTGILGDSAEIQSKIKHEDWNTYRIVAKGFRFQHFINGVATAECVDEDEKERRADGLLALQLHQGPPMKVQFRNIRLKKLGEEKTAKKSETLSVAANGKLSWKGKDIKLDALKKALQKDTPERVTLKVDPQTSTKTVRQILEALSDAGVKKFAFQADVPAAKGPPAAAADGNAKTTRNADILKILGLFSDRNSVHAERNLTYVSAKSPETKKVVLIAGPKSHGYGSHEHKAGCMVFAKALNESGLPIQTEVVTGGWPKDESILDDADSIVIYCDGGGRHPFNKNLDKLNALMKKGVGMVCIHYGVEVPAEPSGKAFLDWTGGYFEANWSVNPHWVAEYEKLPSHPITNGVKPFAINDEWYYHMRFRDQMAGVTPILSDLPPKSTLSRPDGAHSGNPHVRKAIANGEVQHMAWARQREDGGRGFGITGGHFHWNWGHNQLRKLVLNAIAWTAQVDVPADGVPSKALSVEDLMENQDEDVPGNFNPERYRQMIAEWNENSAAK